ncbi:MAG: T9SS type A sorting domain-containing protein, partial [Bacteroidia bacterium]|nr:T9SS type A sorting domain-containing protein [Bacteroidia bacterium]
VKKRWMILSNDGTFDSPGEKVGFHDEEAWKFPEGSVFVKHFELAPETSENGKVRHLETRFFVVAKGADAYGLTYKWNEEGTEAFLQGGGSSKTFDIYEDGNFAYTQVWDYPGRDQCMTCHNNKASYILGVKTHQLNGEVEYVSNHKENQLEFLNALNVFDRKIENPDAYIRSTDIMDEEADLEWKIRSYLDANCASCHRAGVIPEVDMDFSLNRFGNLVEYYDFPTTSHSSNDESVIIKPGDHSQSELWVRDASLEDKQMPPLARNVLDQNYIDSLAYWIDNINIDDIPEYHDLIVFPNPTQGRVALRINDAWPKPYDIRIRTSTGHLLYQNETEEWATTLDMSMYPAGTYFVSVRAGDFRKTEKVVVY